MRNLFTVMKPGNPKPRCQQVHALSEGYRGEILPCLFLPSGGLSSAVGIPWIVAVPLLSLPP